jgi:hypothetical protein
MKNKKTQKRAGKLSLKPLQFDEAVSALLKVKPMPKPKTKR